ncbi:hypothetical protein [Maridesulfovibrio sp.]|uniref:hypothetical protein n=1 Tax=unclassified Maridesulfovibrio TaxID=2794999 RepID=UPI003AFF8BB2
MAIIGCLFAQLINIILLLFFASILYPIYFYISNCPKGAMAGIGVLIQIIILFMERP